MKRFTLGLLAVVLCLAPVRGQTPDDKKATIAYLQSLQTDGGAFAPSADEKGKATVRTTSSALRALKYMGGEAKDPMAAAKFVESCFDKTSGTFADVPGGKPDVFTTAVGSMAAAEAKLPPESYADAVVKYLDENARGFEEIRIAAAGLETLKKKGAKADAWLAEVKKSANDDGTWGKGEGQARDTGGAAAAVLRLGGKLDHPESVVKALKAGQREDGAWGKPDAKASDLETSYRVMRSLHMLKEQPDVAKIRGFVAKCRNADGGYGVAPGQKSSVSGTYFAAIILHWLEEK